MAWIPTCRRNMCPNSIHIAAPGLLLGYQCPHRRSACACPCPSSYQRQPNSKMHENRQFIVTLSFKYLFYHFFKPTTVHISNGSHPNLNYIFTHCYSAHHCVSPSSTLFPQNCTPWRTHGAVPDPQTDLEIIQLVILWQIDGFRMIFLCFFLFKLFISMGFILG